MDTREMLELAAKAAGLGVDKSETNGGGIGNDGFDLAGNVMLDWHNNVRWNPLTDYRDAFQLAAKLQLVVDFFEGEVVGPLCVEKFPPGDLPAACLAITRAAAKEGKVVASTS